MSSQTVLIITCVFFIEGPRIEWLRNKFKSSKYECLIFEFKPIVWAICAIQVYNDIHDNTEN